ncbi:MAG: alanine racemase [Puniceicoccales bacterium]|jgi:alanine racemase|nr:alanine racemase [Puniceicoccales bacterium]
MRGLLEVNLRALFENILKIRKILPSRIQYFSVIKADAYGLGLGRIAAFLGNQHHPLVNGFAVANVQEAAIVRSMAVDLPILILSPILRNELEGLYATKAIPLISSKDELDHFQRFAMDKQFTQEIHIKIDTGMGRVGVWFEDVEDIFAYAQQCSHLQISGIATHFSSIMTDKIFTQCQLSRFQKIVQRYAKPHWLIHASSGFGIGQFIEGTNAVRVGTLQFGVYPFDENVFRRLELTPIVRLSGFVTMVKRLPVGTKIGYDQTYTLERNTRIALLSLGYADGFSTALSEGGEVSIRGQRCKIIGRISMDQMMVDVSDLPQVALGDEAVFFGAQGKGEIPMSEFIQKSRLHTRMCTYNLSQRVFRKYFPEVFSSDDVPEIGKTQSTFFAS